MSQSKANIEPIPSASKPPIPPATPTSAVPAAPPASNTPGVVFCIACRTSSVDVISWERHPTYRIATFRCHLCGHESQVQGFTIGRPYPAASDPVAHHLSRVVDLAKLDMALPRDEQWGGAA